MINSIAKNKNLIFFNSVFTVSLALANPLENGDVIQDDQYPSSWTSSTALPPTTQLLSDAPPSIAYTETQNGYTFSVHNDAQVASLQVSPSVMTNWNSGSAGFNDQTQRNSLSSIVYDFVKDDFDFVFFINNEASRSSSINYLGKLISVSRNISGISKWGNFDYSASTGSSGKLQSYIHLPYLTAVQNGPTLHELAHNWANFFKDFEMSSPTGNYAALPHWGWTGIPGQLGGFDPSTLRDLGGGNWQATNGRSGETNFGGNANGGNGLPYANWELYLMGMMPVDSLDDITYFTNVSTDATRYGLGQFSGTKNTYTVSQFINDRGPRVPSFENSQKNFKCLFVVISDTSLSTSEWNTASSQVAWLVNPANDASSLYNFYEATRGIGTLDANIGNSLINGSLSGTSSSSVNSSSSIISSSSSVMSSSSSISSSVQVSSSSQDSSDPCRDVPLWENRSYNYSPNEQVQYDGKLYTHTDWVNSDAPDINSGWTFVDDCETTVSLNQFIVQSSTVSISETQDEWVFQTQSRITIEFYNVLGEQRTYQLNPGTHTWPKGNRTFFVRYQDSDGWHTTKIHGQ